MNKEKDYEKQLIYFLSDVITKNPLVPKVELYIGLKCNLNCPYCYLSDELKKSKETSFKTFKKLLQKLKSSGVRSIDILGGEPFLYKNRLLYLLDFAKKNNIEINAISTNGLIFDEEIVKKIKETKVNYFQISLDAASKAKYSIVRSKEPKVFDKVVENIKKFVDSGLPVSLSFVVMKPNVSEVPNFLKLAKKLKVKRVSFGTLAPIGNGANVSDWLLSQKEYEKLEKKIGYLKRKYKRIKIIFKAEPKIKRNFCEAGISKVAILPNGNIYPCGLFVSLQKFKLGNLFTKQINKKVMMNILQNETPNAKFYIDRCVACKLAVKGDV
jgi:radical SAM protein with 4Fe4S-binding SPASM domain